MKVIVLTHANLKRPLYCQASLLDIWHWNEATGCTVIYTTKNTMIPVQESPEEIKKLVEQLTPNGQGENNVNK